ncbi:MAG: CsbD family protein [Rhizobiaceae bacterium]
MVNKDQVKGTGKQASGAVKEAAGKITGSKKTEAKGAGEKAAGKVQKAYGDVKEKVKKST